MKIEKAKQAYLSSRKINCAQAIAVAFEEDLKKQKVLTERFSKMGYGKAPGKVCGALYASYSFLDKDEKKAKICKDFEKTAGSSLCKEIRKQKKITCLDCIVLIAELLEKADY